MTKYPACQLLLVLLLTFAAYGQGFIIIDPPTPLPPRPRPQPAPDLTPFPLELKSQQIQATINDQAATVQVEQIFHNPTRRQLQGYFYLPVPEHAAVQDFSMVINGKKMEAELLEAPKAQSIFEDIVRRMRDPALLEYCGQRVLKVRIFPIAPGENREINLTYHQPLQTDNGTIEFECPLRAQRHTPSPVKKISISVAINSGLPLKNVYSPTHDVDVHFENEKRAVVSYETENINEIDDFKLYVDASPSQFGFSLLSYQEQREEGYFFLNISPGSIKQDNPVTEKDITFVLDVSGSMAGEKLRQAKNALKFCVANLNTGDGFEIVRFSTTADALFGKISPANRATRSEARTYIDALRAIGGTNIGAALDLALSHSPSAGRPWFVVFITDGKPTVGDTQEGAILRRLQIPNRRAPRIFTFGIGEEINTHLLDKITDQTNSYRTYIHPDEDIEVKISGFYQKIDSPIMTGLEIEYGQGVRISQVFPAQLPDLFHGQTLSILGRYQGSGNEEITISGLINGIKKSFTYRGEYARRDRKYTFVPPLWAARSIGYLLDQIRLNGETSELKEEIVDLATRYGIVTPYTSYLIVEDEERRLSQGGRINGLRRFAEPSVGSASADYDAFKNKSGEKSIRGSEEVQQLNLSKSLSDNRQGADRLAYRSLEGRLENLSEQNRMVMGRAIYWNGEFWNDSQIDDRSTSQPDERIYFASAAYFDLLRAEPEVAAFMALGRSVRFAWKGKVYRILDQG